MGHKKEQLVKLDESQLKLFAVDEPEAKLRVVRVTANDQAKLRRLRFDRNMEVPGESIISRLFRGAGQDGGSGEAAGVESLAIWAAFQWHVARHDESDCRSPAIERPRLRSRSP